MLDRMVCRGVVVCGCVLLLAPWAAAQEGDRVNYDPPPMGELIAPQPSALVGMLERYNTDRRAMQRLNGSDLSPVSVARFTAFYDDWKQRLEEVDFDSLSQDGRIDYILFRNHLDYQRRQIEIDAGYRSDMADLLSFASIVTSLDDARLEMKNVDSPGAAAALNDLVKQVGDVRQRVEEGLRSKSETSDAGEGGDDEPGPIVVKKTVANRAAAEVDSLRRTLREWNGFYSGYDPIFNWWMQEPYKAADQALDEYANFLRRQLVGVNPDDESSIIGDPIGREALLSDLRMEMIPYTPEELVDIANQEFAWCEAEMLKASRELGYGDDWRAALEFVKTQHVEPGAQPELIRELAMEATEFVESRNLVTVPEFCKDLWRIEMMSPQRQLITPFFTGGEVISVAFPTAGMTHEQKMMSMRGNNRYFSRATVHHELIPGHHLQGYMTSRHATYREMLGTPFWTEGWALYWEMLLWDKGFGRTPEERIGMLFWRSHRCARIIFSLSFHLETMTPQECVDFLVDRVGHERDNAAAEVRRSVGGLYSPLYQCAYMLGGLQFRALHRELVETGEMPDRDFHDAILKMNRIPVEMIRARLEDVPLTRDYTTNWRFYDR
ncbi:MAG: DUF885 domain-containing protein [Phycisphaerales bacterium]|nr:DUF885 domain-containing protein [Phycisphaerales bacterium]